MKTVIKTLAFAMLVISGISLTSCNSKNQIKMKEQNNTSLFPQGEKLSNEWFTGDAYLQPLLARDKNNDFALGSVTFEAGARTHWHTHPKGQVLIVTEGEGLYQEKANQRNALKKAMSSTFPKA